jgi:hypothetical protein
MIRPLQLMVMATLTVPFTTPAKAQAPNPPPSGIEEVRRLYGEAVRSEQAIGRGLGEVERMRIGPAGRDASMSATLQAYTGAFIVLRAKHGIWPPDRLRNVRTGLAVLDSVVTAHPHHAEARYLRLMSCYYLPGLFGRNGSVRDDFAALARLLPGVRAQYPAELYQVIVRFVLQNGRPSPEQRAALEASLHASLASG